MDKKDKVIILFNEMCTLYIEYECKTIENNLLVGALCRLLELATQNHGASTVPLC